MSAIKRKNPKILERNLLIRDRFNVLSNIKGLKNKVVLEKLEQEFLPLEQQTIWLIVSQTGFYKNY